MWSLKLESKLEGQYQGWHLWKKNSSGTKDTVFSQLEQKTMSVREAIKKTRVFYGQADRKCWPPPPLRYFVGKFFKGCIWPWIMIEQTFIRIKHWCQITLLTKTEPEPQYGLAEFGSGPNAVKLYRGAERNSFFGRFLAAKVTPQKSGSRHIYGTPIMQRTRSALVCGLGSLISNLQTPIEGRHTVLYFITLISEKYSTAIC